MKNLQFFPFERNEYYYGKLMTWQDMTSEQKYLNDKRRLINRFLHGPGVASGLQVVGLDDRTVSVEAGMALDEAGREIVLDEHRVMMLDKIAGYDELARGDGATQAYLCLEYSEQGVSPARGAVQGNSAAAASRSSSGGKTGDAASASDQAACTSAAQANAAGTPASQASAKTAAAAVSSTDSKIYDRYREGGRLYLTAVPLVDNKDADGSLTTQTARLFDNNDLAVTCIIPSFVTSGAQFELVLRIEAKHALPEASVELSASLSAMSKDGREHLEESWSGALQAAGDVAEIREMLTAFSIEDGTGSITIKRRQLKVTVAGREIYPAGDTMLVLPISTKNVYRQMEDAWYVNSMNQILGRGGAGGIYLARLFFRSTGDGLRIERIEQLPFGQKVSNSYVNNGLMKQLIKDVDGIRAELGREKTGTVRKTTSGGPQKTATGVCVIPLGIGGKSGDRFYSGEIVHGLGLGRLSIELSLEADELQYFGSAEIFEDMKIRAEMAAKANTERGSFVIGIRLLESTSVENVTVRWNASILQENNEQSAERRIRVLPDKPELRVMQSRYFRTETENLNGATILWEVCTTGGGTISRDGLYTAPDTEGIYEVRAFCQEDPKIRSSVFVIVRE